MEALFEVRPCYQILQNKTMGEDIGIIGIIFQKRQFT